MVELRDPIESVFVRQQDRRREPIGFRDDPQFHLAGRSVCRNDAFAVLQGVFIFPGILIIDLTPVACDVSL
ncbi:hypothetical protein [Thalassoroseus pseudoceratinae]|uniref:hypothetical protein n=1 Tax=Thalassoroseus pseudoceratinae TaxID=2713176 RepID=UPI00141F5F85|nr:hypothetical protein [Thalassoroseus pseudoceratinae]